MEKTRKPKKSETLEVRIPHETKQAFLTACREDGTTASEVVRGSVQTYLDERERPYPQQERTLVMRLPQPVRRYGLRAAAGGLAAIGLTTFAVLPSAAEPEPNVARLSKVESISLKYAQLFMSFCIRLGNSAKSTKTIRY
jgi:hypothetical protein